MAILVFDGVHIIDYAAPFEVFGQAGFRVFTVGSTTKPVTTAMGQTLVPTLSTFHDVSEEHAEKYPCALVEQAKSQREEAYDTLAAAR